MAGKDRDTMSYLYWNRNGAFHEPTVKCFTRIRRRGFGGAISTRTACRSGPTANHKIFGATIGVSEVWKRSGGVRAKRTTPFAHRRPHGLSAVEPGTS